MKAKATISKSEVMKQAWKSYKLFNSFNEKTKQYGKILMSFATALKRAWAYVKELATKQPVPFASFLKRSLTGSLALIFFACFIIHEILLICYRLQR